MEIRALTPAEQKYTYAQSMQLEGQTSNIGHLRGDFASSGYGFYTTWFDTRPQWKTDEFKKELDEVINSLREDKGLLHNRYDMSAFAKHYPESAFAGSYCTEYGFRVDTEKHAFLFRCNPTKGDYNFYCYCFVKEWLDKHMADIKTRDAVKGTIKTIDKAAVASERMKSAYSKIKSKAEQGYYADENSATEYAADKVSAASERITDEGVHQFNKQGQKGVKTTKDNVVKAKDTPTTYPEFKSQKI